MADPCNAYLPKLSALLDGALSASEQGLVEEHLAGCGACSGRLADLAVGSQLLQSSLLQAAGDVDWKRFTERVMERVQPERPSLLARVDALFGKLFPRPAVGWALAGALGLVAVAGVGYLAVGGSGAPGTGYRAEQMAVKAVQSEPDVSPVVMEADQGGAIIFLVDHPQQRAQEADVAADGTAVDAGTPKAQQEEGGDL